MIATGCKTMNLLPEKSGRYLRNHVIQTMTVSSQSMCRIMCYLNDSCLSYNFHESTSTCEINDSDELQHPGDLISSPEHLYRGTKNDCKDHTCPSNSTCQAIFTKKGGYICVCPKGFTGKSCEIEIDECKEGTHTCSYARCENTIGSFRCIPLDGTYENPAKSCLYISRGGYSNGTGEYWLNPTNTGSPFKVLCDMTSDGGGWTVVSRLVQPGNTVLPWLKLDTYEIMKEYNRRDKTVIPMAAAMLDIKNKMGFDQIHFYCHKVSVGRVVSIMTKKNTEGQAVVNFFTNTGVPTTFPAACDSYDRLPDDTSILSRGCTQWGNKAPNTWGGTCCPGPMRLPAMAFHIRREYTFEFTVFYSCDNPAPTDNTQKVPPDANDRWQISVR